MTMNAADTSLQSIKKPSTAPKLKTANTIRKRGRANPARGLAAQKVQIKPKKKAKQAAAQDAPDS